MLDEAIHLHIWSTAKTTASSFTFGGAPAITTTSIIVFVDYPWFGLYDLFMSQFFFIVHAETKRLLSWMKRFDEFCFCCHLVRIIVRIIAIAHLSLAIFAIWPWLRIKLNWLSFKFMGNAIVFHGIASWMKNSFDQKISGREQAKIRDQFQIIRAAWSCHWHVITSLDGVNSGSLFQRDTNF